MLRAVFKLVSATLALKEPGVREGTTCEACGGLGAGFGRGEGLAAGRTERAMACERPQTDHDGVAVRGFKLGPGKGGPGLPGGRGRGGSVSLVDTGAGSKAR